MVNKINLVDELSAIVGEVVWRPIRTHGSMFLLHFGEHDGHSKDKKHRGKFHFLIEFANWYFLHEGECVATMDSRTEEIDNVFRMLSPDKVLNIKMAPRTKSISIEIGNSFSVIMEPCLDKDCQEEIQWIFFSQNGSWRLEGEDILFSISDINPQL